MNQNLKLRIMTALVGVPIILTCLIGLGVGGVAFFAWVVSMGMLYEFCRMFFTLEDAKQKTYLALLANCFIHGINYFFTTSMSMALLGLGPVFFFFILFLFLVPKLLHYGGKDALNSEHGAALLEKHLQELMALCFGMVYCVWFPILMVAIRELTNGKFWLLLGLIIVWSNDTFAYFAGKYFGKHPLYETISPKKTREGAIGGFLGAALLSFLFVHFFLPHESALIVAVVILTVSISSILGDLCESLLKRASRVKDSGSILPGHGGFLDRFDGVVFAMPALYAILWLTS